MVFIPFGQPLAHPLDQPVAAPLMMIRLIGVHRHWVSQRACAFGASIGSACKRFKWHPGRVPCLSPDRGSWGDLSGFRLAHIIDRLFAIRLGFTLEEHSKALPIELQR